MADTRTGKRFPLQLPITIESGKSPKRHKGTTANVSAAGVYITSDVAFEIGSKIEFEITLPALVIGTQRDVEIRCRGRVVRIEATRENKKAPKRGLACVIDNYKFIRR